MRAPVIALTLALACTPSAPPDPAPRPAQAEETPTAPPGDLRVERLTPEALPAQFTEVTGRPRLVHLWASWCAPCVHELPNWRQLTLRHRDLEVRMISVDVPSVHATKVEPLLRSRDLTGPRHLLLMSDNPTPLLAAAPGWRGEIPHTVAIDATGAVRGTWARPMSPIELEAAVAAISHPTP